jgi:hypothetical protein
MDSPKNAVFIGGIQIDVNILILSFSLLLCTALMLLFSGKRKNDSKPKKLYPYMLGLATGNPKYKVSQKDALKIAMRAPGCEKIRNVLERIYSNTRISNRFMAIPDFTPEQRDPDDDLFYPEDSFSVPVQDRLDKFKEGVYIKYMRIFNAITTIPTHIHSVSSAGHGSL